MLQIKNEKISFFPLFCAKSLLKVKSGPDENLAQLNQVVAEILVSLHHEVTLFLCMSHCTGKNCSFARKEGTDLAAERQYRRSVTM